MSTSTMWHGGLLLLFAFCFMLPKTKIDVKNALLASYQLSKIRKG